MIQDGRRFEITPVKHFNDGNEYKVKIKIPMFEGWIEDVKFITIRKGMVSSFGLDFVGNKDGCAYFEKNIFLENGNLYHYYFSYLANGIYNVFVKNYILGMEDDWQLSVNYDAPDWAKGANVYHIFVDRFNRGSKSPLVVMPRRNIHLNWDEDIQVGPDKDGIWNNDFYGGDLLGIIDKLDYLKDLGIDILYLSPISMSQSNHRYDTGDYETVDPYAGSNDDLRLLCKKSHEKGMRIVLDCVFNHTGNDSKYFNEFGSYDTLGAYQSKESPYYKFYKKINGMIDYWWEFKNLPVCDKNSPEWKEYVCGVGGIIDQLFAMGIDGIRLDVADELSDDFIKEIRNAVLRNKKDGLIIGEVWENPMHMGRNYMEYMNSVMDYQIMDALIRYFKYGDTYKLDGVIRSLNNDYPDSTRNTLMNSTSTHDISRLINIFGSDEFNYYAKWAWDLKNEDPFYCQKVMLTPDEYAQADMVSRAYTLALAYMPGMFTVFYGDEIGMQGLGNLANRRTFPKNGGDKERLMWFRELLLSRKKVEAIREGKLKLYELNKKYMMFERKSRDETALVTVQRTNEEVNFNYPAGYSEKGKVLTLNNSSLGHLNPHGGIVVKRDR